MVVPQNGWVYMENPFKMDALGVPPFKETPTKTPPKTSMTMKKHPGMKMYFLLQIVIVLFHASFQGWHVTFHCQDARWKMKVLAWVGFPLAKNVFMSSWW